MFQFYTATVTPTTGTSFSLSSPDWFSGLKAGEVLSLDYQMTFDGEVQPKITSILLNGNDACSNENPTTVSESPTSTTAPTTSTTTNGPPITTTTASTGNPTTTTEDTETTTHPSGGSGSCSTEITNSWANNVQGKLQFTLPNDISDFTIELVTDIPLTNIQVQFKTLLQQIN